MRAQGLRAVADWRMARWNRSRDSGDTRWNPTLADPADSAHKIGHVRQTTPGHTLAFPADSAHKISHVTEATPGPTLACPAGLTDVEYICTMNIVQYICNKERNLVSWGLLGKKTWLGKIINIKKFSDDSDCSMWGGPGVYYLTQGYIIKS
jgi:hypothetical protein